jgi:hypothetical protein
MDFKYGVGVFVQAKENWQLLLYAIGKVAELALFGCEVSRITLVISQPRCHQHNYLFDMWDVEANELLPYIQKARAAIRDGRSLKAGPWCKFCSRKAYCEVFARHVNSALPSELHSPADFEKMAMSLTTELIAEILDREEAVKDWFKAIKAQAYRLVKLGADVPGWEIDPTLGNRIYVNPVEAEKVLLKQFGDVIYEPLKLRSPAQMEKIKGSKPYIAKLTVRPTTGESLKRKKQDG